MTPQSLPHPASAHDDGPTCDASFRQIVLACAEAIDEGLAELQDSDDPRGPHKARVGLRRLTTALDAFAPILRRKKVAALRARAKQMFRVLGQLRDSDVQLEIQTQIAGSAGLAKRQQRNDQLRQTVRERVTKSRLADLTSDIVGHVQPDGALFRRSRAARRAWAAPLRGYAAGLLDGAWRRCLSYGVAAPALPDAMRHEFRKDMKTLRYLAEFFETQFPGLGAEPFLSDFRAIQDALGVLNDYAVAKTQGGRRAASPLPPAEAEALASAGAAWSRLADARPPWRD